MKTITTKFLVTINHPGISEIDGESLIAEGDVEKAISHMLETVELPARFTDAIESADFTVETVV